ncbi:protein BTG3-like [Gouania willdenowi]|uniref:protein BTG3-like n=1 Tax=Gouania willdenowi TaxID=441366 RepID=UPI001056AA5D|nr:protein BTG3-like [Gouania willdenowi]
MRNEIAAVVSFLKRLVKLKNKVEVEKMDLFAERLTVALQEKFEGHWVPEKPSKGQAYRCIRVNAFHKYDQELLRACSESGVHYGDLGLPWEITLWVDPGEVCGRYGEQNFHFSIATFSSDKDEMTSDYHSGSSDEGSTRSSPLTITNRKCQALNPDAPAWEPKKKLSGMVHKIP